MELRDYIIEYLEQLLASLKDQYANLGDFEDVDSLHGPFISWYEMFARSTYGIIALTSVRKNNPYVEIYNKTLFSVLNSNIYSTFKDYDQKAVELIPLIAMLCIHQELTWDTYTEIQKKQILLYFENINNIAIHTNNWQFFRFIVTSILEKLGHKSYTKEKILSWHIIESCYTGEGWYRDGQEGPKDYYIAFGYHFYSLLYCYLFPENSMCKKLKDRAKNFALDYFAFFDNEGRMIPYGRSLIYRYATLSFWSLFLLNEVDKCLNPKIIEVIKKSIEWWKQQEIVNKNGILNLGYCYRNETICEDYNSSGSVYWIMKFFLILLIDKNNPIWTIVIQPNKNCNKTMTIANGDHILTSTELCNTLYPNSYFGSPVPQKAAKYMRFAYNSAVGFNLSKDPTDFRSLSDDSSLIFNIAGVKHQREKNIFYRNHEWYQEFLWKCGDLISIRSLIIPMNYAYIRIHYIDAKINCECYETGYAIDCTAENVIKKGQRLIVKNNNFFSAIESLLESGSLIAIKNQPNSNIYHKHTIMPALKFDLPIGKSLIIDITYFTDNPHIISSLTKDFSFSINNSEKQIYLKYLDNSCHFDFNDFSLINRNLRIQKIKKILNRVNPINIIFKIIQKYK